MVKSNVRLEVCIKQGVETNQRMFHNWSGQYMRVAFWRRDIGDTSGEGVSETVLSPLIVWVFFSLQNDDFIGKVRKRTLFVYFPFAAPGQYLSFHRWDDTYLAAGISPVDQ